MPLDEEDLRFKLTVDPDTANMQEAIKDIGKELDVQAKQAKINWDALGKAGAAQLESIKAHQKFTDAFAAPKIDIADAIDVRAEQMKTITAERIGSGVGSLIKLGAEALGPVGIALTAIGVGSVAAVKGLKEMASTIAGFAGVASPGSLRQWELAVRDLQGVIGQTAIPVLNLMTDAVRLLGDVFANFLPNAKEMAEILAPLKASFAAMAEEARHLLAALGPIVRIGVAAALQTITDQLQGLAVAATLAGKAFEFLFPGLATLGGAGRSAQGTAAIPGGIRTGDEYQKVNIEAALNSFGGQTVPQKQLAVLEQIRDVLRQQQKGGFNPNPVPLPGMPGSDPHGINRALGFGF